MKTSKKLFSFITFVLFIILLILSIYSIRKSSEYKTEMQELDKKVEFYKIVGN